MAPFTKPEAVLKQAEGLISVGQTHAALQSLTEIFSSKKFRSTPLTSLEPIMHRFIELCVDLRKGRTAKEGLMQYKNIAQNTSVQSIESVITRFVQLADAKVREAQEKAAVKSAVDVDDLEASETPESILLGAVSGDQSKDRTDRALVTPWLKFLWESYRTSLETLKNNARLETIYQQIAQQAFKFCLKHQRKVEFRRLCETLRLHLSNVAKYSHQQHSINLSDPETLQHHLDTRFAQLNTSVELELWQEAFRSVEDVHNLLTMAKKAPRPAMMANYYEKLTKIFLMSGNALFHAAAWGKYYGIVTGIGGRGQEEMSRLAGQVLVSTLAVPVGLHTDEPDELKGKNARLTSLLGLSRMPSRASLLRDALSRNVLKLAPESIRQLYNILEVTFDPLTLCTSVAPLLKDLATDEAYAPYLPLLQRALLSRLLSQLSQVYSSVKIENLLSLVEPLKGSIDGAFDAEQVEAYIMGCARRGELDIRVDHRDGSITFADNAFVTYDESIPSTSYSHENVVQPSMSDLVRTRLSNVAVCLHTSLRKLGVDEEEVALGTERQSEMLKALVSAVEDERKALALRRAVVARRRELLSELSIRKEKEESSRRAEINRREKEEESRRARDELKRKENERVQRQMDVIKIDEAKKLAQSLVEKGVLKADDLDKMEINDKDKLVSMQVVQHEKETKEREERLRIISKRIDHIERAYRKDERPLLSQDYESQQKIDRETFEEIQKSRKDAAKHAHQEDLITKARLSKMMTDYQIRREVIISRKGEEFAKKKEAAQRKIEEEKEKRKTAVLKAREEERLREEKEEEDRRKREEEEEAKRAEEERLEEEQRMQEEEEHRVAEEEAKQKEEAAAETRKQRDAERAAAMEEARKKMQREEEAEARRKQLREQQKAPTAPATVPIGETAWRRSAVPRNSVPSTPIVASNTPPRAESPAPAATAKFRPGAVQGGWRERLQAKEAASAAGGNAIPRSASPAPVSAPAPKEELKKDDDGFQSVPSKNVWRPRRGRGQ
ncbi:hypothetical protein BDQ17DRAFT_1343010 [Cyathus striatus]|nr:hypothetical protein BDQ17DRAFT_1343010 [Cyathus striatus]